MGAYGVRVAGVLGRAVRLAVTALVLAALLPPVSACAQDASRYEVIYQGDFIRLVNHEREANGLALLHVAGDLTDVARAHSRRMAAENRTFHNAGLRDQVRDWIGLGENVGTGASVDAIHREFMASPRHRANVLRAADNRLGVGVALRNGVVFVTEIFATRLSTNGGARCD